MAEAPRTTSVYLTDDELVLLDGRCGPEVQPTVDAAKARIAAWRRLEGVPRHIAALVADVVSEAQENGRIVFWRAHMTTCRVCNRNDGYWPHARSSRYHRRGQPNYNNPKTLGGYEFARRSVTIQNHVSVGGCDDCVSQARPHIIAALADVRAEVPKELTGHEPTWRRFTLAHCEQCGWDGHEGQMIKLRTLMGDGWYAGECPKCHAKNLPLARNVITLLHDKWTVVEASAEVSRA